MKDIQDIEYSSEIIRGRENKTGKEKKINLALVGNPNTGKSTIFNALTGLRQHTGNWPGKTVASMEGYFSFQNKKYNITDLPGAYSLISDSDDEQVTRDFLLLSKPQLVIVVVDATRLERNLVLALQVLQVCKNVIVCLNLMDEAAKSGITVNIAALSEELGVPVVPTVAREKKGLVKLQQEIDTLAQVKAEATKGRSQAIYTDDNAIEALSLLNEDLLKLDPALQSSLWISSRLLEGDESITNALLQGELSPYISLRRASKILEMTNELNKEIDVDLYYDRAQTAYNSSIEIAGMVINKEEESRLEKMNAGLDKIMTSKYFGFPIMLILLALVLWLTIIGSNVPSQILSILLIDQIYPLLKAGAASLHFPFWLSGLLIDGVYLATAWVISVMLPPMAIFFPLFTLLEDFGYLPRVAFNLDSLFKKSGAHGKQALTMSMGFGCNAAGVVSTRIINSPREKLIAIITNNFSLCNGRWPTQILMATIFIGVLAPPAFAQTVATLSVVLIVLLGIGFTFFTSWLLSKTMLKGEVSFFTLELPPYRKPKLWQTLYTSFIDRTLIVLWRAIVFAAPAGAIIWGISNIEIGEESLAVWMIHGMDPIGYRLGLNGVVLLAFIVAIPANEIIIPTILMLSVLVMGSSDLGQGAGILFEGSDQQVADILLSSGWTTLTGINLMLLSLLHNPCSTTIYTIYKETKSTKWTLVATLLPILYGLIICFAVAFIWRIF